MARYIGGKPSIQIRDCFKIKRNRLEEIVFPFNEKRLYFFFSARYALAAALNALSLKEKDIVLLPSYNCGVEIDPIIYFGIKPVFYNINKNFLIDFDDLSRKIIRGVKAVLVTHFLGFPQPIDEIKEICLKRNLYLIEDCAHAFLSSNNGKPLGSFGDIAIFSLLKTIPVPNGGVLLINNKNIKYTPNSKKPSRFATLFYAAELLKYKSKHNGNSVLKNSLGLLSNVVYLSLSVTRVLLAGIRKYFNTKGLYLIKPDSYLFIEELQTWGISDLGKKVINCTNYGEVKNKRRKNFEYMLNYFLKNGREILIINELPVGVCPLFFPIILKSAEERETLYNNLKSKGIITHPWWDRFHPEVPWDEFPDAVYLKERLFGLPIHQDLTMKDLDVVISEFEKAYHEIQRE